MHHSDGVGNRAGNRQGCLKETRKDGEITIVQTSTEMTFADRGLVLLLLLARLRGQEQSSDNLQHEYLQMCSDKNPKKLLYMDVVRR